MNPRSQFTGLVVEDEWLLRMELADELLAVGWRTLEAGTGEAALDVIDREERIDFLITDIRLPGSVDGWSVADAFRLRHPQGAVIYVSANPDLSTRRAEGSVFIGKPCDVRLLLQTCDRLLSVG
ncbi:MAG TPA: response regulator [Rhizomicrobium sp.]|jgi:CheY-like chemotaxis protein